MGQYAAAIGGALKTAAPYVLAATTVLAPSLLAKKGSSPKSGKAAATAPTATPAPDSNEVARASEEAAEREMLRRRVSGGRSTILTGPLGQVSDNASVGRTILGGA